MRDEMMRAVRHHEYGPPEVLVVEQVQRPVPGEGQVLVRVHAAGVNPFDWKMRRGFLQAYVPLTFPSTRGIDLAGVVEAVGPGVTAFRKGQEVFGLGAGTYADFALAEATGLALKPRNLTFDQAAALPLGGRTAWAAIFDAGDLQPGQRLLVQGAAGGVGNLAVQLGRWKGAYVVGTASAANVDFVRSLGADQVVDYNATPFETAVRDVDVVLETVGGEVEDRSWQVLKPGGILVTTVSFPQEDTAQRYAVRAVAVPQVPAGPILQRLADLIESGTVTPVVQRAFPLEEASQAHALSETGHGRGRIVLHVAD